MQLETTRPVQWNSLVRRIRIAVIFLLIAPIVGVLGGEKSSVQAQNRQIQDRQAQNKQSKKKRAPAKKKAKYESISLQTKDGVQLACTYYPGNAGKKTVPVILLHDWDSNRGEMHPLALYLQKLKHAVITPDLRGHGQSTQQRGTQGEIDRDKMKKPQIAAMKWDIEAVKKFLIGKNNTGELNIEQLCVVGTGFGATLALNWAVVDWNARSLPAFKMGQDVKGLVLISPLSSFKGLTTQAALAHPIVRRDLSVFIAVGREDSRRLGDAKRIFNSLERYHTNKNEQDLFFVGANTSLQGVQLIGTKGVELPQNIAFFIDQRLVKKSDLLPWRDRKGPFDE